MPVSPGHRLNNKVYPYSLHPTMKHQMNNNEFIDIVKKIEIAIYPNKEKSMDDSCFAVIQGLLQGKTYTAIADELNYDEGYVGEKSRLIFRLLSKFLGEKVTKSNFRWILQSRMGIEIQSNKHDNKNLSYCDDLVG